jgi:hypothetical protein
MSIMATEDTGAKVASELKELMAKIVPSTPTQRLRMLPTSLKEWADARTSHVAWYYLNRPYNNAATCRKLHQLPMPMSEFLTGEELWWNVIFFCDSFLIVNLIIEYDDKAVG